MRKNENDEDVSAYISKVWIAVGIITLSAVCLLMFYAAFSVFLLAFAGILIAVFFRGLSGLIQRKTKWKENICVGISVISSLVFVAAFFWLIGAQVQAQVAELSETLPKTIEKAKSTLRGSSLGDEVLERVESDDSSEKIQGFATSFFRSTFGAFGDVYIVLFIGIFLTVSPYMYISGAVQLVPSKGQSKAKHIFEEVGQQLRNWIKGTMLSMFVVFVLTAIGLAILGIPLWLVLALLAGLLSFIPNLGPLLALIPAVLVGLLQGPQTALMVAGLYILIQFIESNFITTLIQQKMINMPPALIILAQMVLGALTGSWGLILSTPLTVVVIVLVKQLYIDDQQIKGSE